MTTIAEIADKFEELVAAVIDLPIATEGVRYKPSVGTPFVRIKVLPVEPTTSSIGRQVVQELRGLVQVDVMYSGLNNVANARATVELIIEALFPAQHLIGTTQQLIIDNTWVEAAREGDAWVTYPILVRWRAYLA